MMQSASAKPTTPWAGTLPAIIALIGCGLFALALPSVPDHAYQFHLAGRLLDGQRMYVDAAAADMHPPLFTWLAMALEAGGRVAGIRGLHIFPFAILLTLCASLYAVWQIGPRSPVLLATLVVALLPVAGPYYGQGEHMAVILALPYLFGAAATMRGERLPPVTRILIGSAAAVGLAMKPHFALVWVGVEVWLAHRRGPSSLWRMESVVVSAGIAVYIAATALVTPEFFSLVPWLMRLYPLFGALPLPRLLLDARTLLLVIGLVAGGIARSNPRYAELVTPLMLGALAMFASMLMQTKGWGYHWYPVSAFAVMLIGMGLESRTTRVRSLLVPITAAAILVMSLQVDRTVRLMASAPTFLPELLRIVDEHAAGRPLVVLSRHIHAAFPLVNLAGSGWHLPYAHLWMVPAIAAQQAAADPSAPRPWTALEREIIERVWSTIHREPPALLIVEAPLYGQFDMTSYFGRDERFRELFERAVIIDTVGYYLVYRP